MSLTKKQVTEAIEDYEYLEASAGGRLNGVSVRAVNVKVTKDKYVADVIVKEDGETHRADECEYSQELIEKHYTTHLVQKV